MGNMIRMRNRERGAALLSLALALAVGISVSAGAFWIATAGVERSKLERTVVFVEEVAEAIFAVSAMKPDFASLDERDLRDQGLLQDSYWYAYNLRSPLGDVGMAPWSIGGGCATNGYCNNAFRITLEDVTVEQCRYLMVKNFGGRHIQSGVRTTDNGWMYFSSSPTIDEVEDACGTSNIGIFTSYFFG